MRRSQAPLVERRQTEEIDSPLGQADGAIGGSAPQSVGAHAASAFSELEPEPEPDMVELGWFEPHAINRLT